MINATDAVLREQLLDRRRRLSQAAGLKRRSQVARLLKQVDSALAKMEAGSFGVCEVCHGTIESGRLLADPCASVCLECFTPQQKRDLERDLAAAASIQSALFPKPSFTASGWQLDYHLEPVGPVSGDYIDWIRKSDSDDVFFLFGDVAGKGVAASLLTAHLHALFRSLIEAALPFKEMLRRANRLFCDSTMSSSYATLLIGRLETDGKVELANAGHPAPLWQNERLSKSFAPTGLPFGLFCESEFEVHRFQMKRPDVLLMYTDGLSEARNGSGEEYGHARLVQLLQSSRGAPARTAIQACLQDLNAFQGGFPRSDDLAVMAIRRD